METNTFLMPDYYPAFSCKIGACRTPCCTGWPVSFSLEDYFKLINEDCSDSLHEIIDRGIKISLHPTPERYAEILPAYDGNCPMRLEDGRCSLHSQLGEKALSNVCRLYPRGIRKEMEGFEISCANSCEAVLELLLSRPEPLTFITKELCIDLPPLQERTIFYNTYGNEQKIRRSLIQTMQNRCMPIPERLVVLEKRLISVDAAMKSGSPAAIDKWLIFPDTEAPVLPDVAPIHLTEGLLTAEKLVSLIDEHSSSIRSFGEQALHYFTCGKNAFGQYRSGVERFETIFPDWTVFFEHMLVNHMFFSCFPFEDRPEELKSEYMAMCSIYTLLRFLAIGCSEHMTRREDYIDLFAAAFRLIDHTAFDIYVSHLLNDLGWTTDGEMLEWIIL